MSSSPTPTPVEPVGKAIDTHNNLTPLLQIMTWVFIVVTILVGVVQTRFVFQNFSHMKRNFALSLAMLTLGVGQAIAASFQNSNGFGKHIHSLSWSQVNTALKSQYAANLLYVACIAVSKVSCATFVGDLTPSKSHQTAKKIISLVIFLWALASFIALAVQCHEPSPYDYIHGTCFNRNAYWNAFGALNIITDIALLALSTCIMLRLHIRQLSKRVKVALYFAPRLLAILAQAIELVYWNQRTPSADVTFDQWPVVLCMQVVITTAMIVTYVPQLKTFMISLESGMVRLDDLRRTNRQGDYLNTGYFTGRKQTKSSSVSDQNSSQQRSVPRHKDLLQRQQELSEERDAAATAAAGTAISGISAVSSSSTPHITSVEGHKNSTTTATKEVSTHVTDVTDAELDP